MTLAPGLMFYPDRIFRLFARWRQLDESTSRPHRDRSKRLRSLWLTQALPSTLKQQRLFSSPKCFYQSINHFAMPLPLLLHRCCCCCRLLNKQIRKGISLADIFVPIEKVKAIYIFAIVSAAIKTLNQASLPVRLLM